MNLVFASGFLVPQHFLGIDYFRGLAAHFEGRHATLFPVVQPLASSEARASALADAIQQKYPQGAIHIIAHSMGGLDSRILIDRNHHGLSDPGRVASLTTLSTPHRGSPVADLLLGSRPGDLRSLAFDGIRHAFALLDIDIGALADLTTRAALQAPDVIRTHPHIRYRSYSASGRSGRRPTCLALVLGHQYIHSVTGQDNDGLVAVDSARYGEFQQPSWQCDHEDMVGHDLDGGEFQFDHLAAFDDVIGSLEQVN